MKILLFNQPFPMGGYHLKQAESKYLSSLGHEVYLLEQLNGMDYDEEYWDDETLMELILEHGLGEA